MFANSGIVSKSRLKCGYKRFAILLQEATDFILKFTQEKL